MKITVTDLDGVLGPIALGDDSVGDLVVDPPPLPDEARQAQIEALADSDRVFAHGRGNRATSFSWTVARNHADAAAAEAFVHAHAAAVPINCGIEFVDSSAAYASAVMVRVAMVEWYGKATTVRYSVEGAVPA